MPTRIAVIYSSTGMVRPIAEAMAAGARIAGLLPCAKGAVAAAADRAEPERIR